LREAIERTTEAIDVTIENIVARRWVHVDLIMQLTVKKKHSSYQAERWLTDE
jgi:hypothetical protein